MTVYRSKISWGIAVFLVAIFGSSFITAATSGETNGLIVLIAVALLIIHLYLNTNYTIKNNALIVKCSFYKITIDIKAITKVKDTNSVLSAPALSLDRLALFYGGYTVISPKNKAGFVAHLQKINPQIQYQPKLKR